MGARLLAAVLVCLTLSACGPKTKPAMVSFDRSALAVVNLVAQTERDLSTQGLLTPQQSLAIRLKLRPVIDVGEKATAALLIWQPGQPTPMAVLDLSRAITDLVNTVVLTLPDSGAKAQLLTAIAAVQSVWAEIMRAMSTSRVHRGQRAEVFA